MPSIQPIKNTLARVFPAFQIKGVEANRAPLPKTGMTGSYGGYGSYGGFGDGDYYDSLMNAIRGVNVRRSKIDFRTEAGDMRFNSIVSICLSWIGTTWPQAPVRIGQVKNGDISPLDGGESHPLVRLLRRPNETYNGKWMTWALNNDYWVAGDAYCRMVTNGRNNLTGDIVELEWLPAFCTEPKPDSTGRLACYEYTANGSRCEYAPEEIIHFRFGINPQNPLKGLSPLLAQDRFLVQDNCGGEYGAGLLLNGGLPAALLVPEPPPAGSMTPPKPLTKEQAEELTRGLAEKFRDEPGMIPFIGNAVRLLTLGFKPSEMALGELMEMPETRIPAAFGIPPEVLKLRVGLMRSTSNNIGESRKAAWQDCLAPAQDTFGEEWTESALLLRFGGKDNQVIYYDRSNVGVLQPDVSAIRTDAANLVSKGVISRADGKRMVGIKPTPEDETIYATGGAGADSADTADSADDIVKRANAAGTLIRSGFKAEASAEAAGLPDIEHTGFLPVTLQRGEDVPAIDDTNDPEGGSDDATNDKTDDVKKKTKRRQVKSENNAALKSLEVVAQGFRAALKAREDSAVADMNVAYDTAQQSIESALADLVARMQQAEANGETISPVWLAQEARYKALLDQIETELGKLSADQVQPLTAAQRDCVTTGATEARALAEVSAGSKPGGVTFTWNALPTQAIEALVGHCSDGSPLRDLLDELGPDASLAVRNALTAGLALGDGADKLAARVRAITGSDSQTGLTRARASNIVRTEIHRAVRAASIQSYRDNAHIMDGVWIWLSAADSRTCSCCWAMHGTEHDLTETLDGHCSCRCVAVPKTKSWAELTGDDSIPDTRPQIDLGEELFADLPADVQKQILGPALYAHYQAGTVSLSDTVTQTSDARWGTMRREATVEEALANAGNTGNENTQ